MARTIQRTPVTAETGPDARRPDHHRLSPPAAGFGDGHPFANEPLRDFAQADVRRCFAEAIDSAVVPPVPAAATVEQADEAITEAASAFPSWRDLAPLERSRKITRAATLLRVRRDDLAGVMVREAGKTGREADADVAEAIDFF